MGAKRGGGGWMVMWCAGDSDWGVMWQDGEVGGRWTFFFLFIHYSCATYLDHDEGRAPICTVRFPAAVRV